MRRLRLLAVAVGALLTATASAQPDTTAVRDLDAVEVTAAPFVLAPSRLPLALTVRQRGAAELATEPGTSLDALGRGLPGVWISDRNNASTGERVLVRGLGWRANFGVRGTHVILDGVPLTLADGQGQLNVVEAGLVDRVEVIRGPASTFWGSGSAGVLSLSTDPSPGPARGRVLGGAYGLAKAEAAVRPDLGGGRRLSVWASALRQDGYREHGASQSIRGGASGSMPLGDGTVGVVALGAVVPRAESPGGISQEDAAADPRQTRAIVVQQDASKALAQGHLAVSVAQPLGAVRLRVTATGGARTLDNPIIPRYITLDRRSGGLRVTAEGGDRLVWGVGVEGEAQRDDRLERVNDSGQPGAEVLTDQVETVRSGAAFGRLAASVGALTASVAARADVLRYDADVATGTGGGRTLSALSPSVGLAYQLAGSGRAATIYANAAGALDAPTTVELGNRVDGLPGFNPDLQPERTWGAEAGVRATLAAGGGLVGVDAAVFVAWARDLLLPFEVDDVTAYRNEGEARHEGVEVGLSADDVAFASGRVHGAIAVTAARGVFLDGSTESATPSGGRVPGFPPGLATWTLTWEGRGVIVGLDGEAAAAYAADSAGEQVADGYAVANVRLGFARLAVAGTTLAPFVTVRNVTDAPYAGSVVVNAFGGRFVEPAPGRHVIAGVSVTFP